MEKIKRPLRANINQVRLFFEDLVTLTELLKETSENIEIEADDYKLESIEEILKLTNERISNLRIKTSKPYATIEFQKHNASIYISEDTPAQRGTFEKIKSFLETQKKPLLFLLSPGWKLTSILSITGITVALFKDSPKFPFILAIYIVAFATLIYASWHSSLNTYSLIYARKRDEHRSFWHRKRDDIFLATIAALIGSLITLLFSKI